MAIFPSDRYTPDAIYVLSNGYYIDFKQNGPELIAVTKTPEGAVWNEGDSSFASEPKILVEEAILNLPPEFGEIEIVEIIQKQTPPPPPRNNTFKVLGKTINASSEPISNATITPNFISFPPPPPPPQGEGNNSYTDFESTIFALGAPIIVAPTSSDENGLFEFTFISDDEINFDQSYIQVTKENYSSKQIGPKLLKTGEQVSTRSSTRGSFKDSISVIDVKNLPKEGANFVIEVTVKNLSTEEEAKGIGKSTNSSVARSKAQFDAEQQFVEINSEEETITTDVYDLGKIILLSNKPSENQLRSLEIKSIKEIQLIENNIIVKTLKSDLPLEVRAQLIFATKKEELKMRAIPYVLTLLARFGPNIVNSILGKQKDPLSDAACLPKEQLQEILNKRNELTRTINNAYKVVRTLSKILNISRAFIAGIQAGLLIAQALSAFPPGKFGWSGLLEKGFKEVDKILRKTKVAVNGLSILAATVGAILAFILDLLSKLDFLLQQCSEQVDPETGEFVLDFVEINEELNTFIDPTSNQLETIIDPLTNKPYPYKGFSFEIQQDTSQNFQYPKRYAIARNIQGIQVLKSESSFASNPEILIEELKFVIDRDNLRAD